MNQEEFQAQIDAAHAAAMREAAPKPKAPSLAPRTVEPTELFDTKTGQQVQLDPEDAARAIETGAVGPVQGSLINVVAPTGQHGAVPGESLGKLLQQGYRLESQREERLENYLTENEGVAGTAKVGIGKFLSEAAFGVPEAIYKHTAPSEDVEQWEALNERHQAASYGASALGFGANLLVGGPLFKAAATAGKAAEGAVIGGRAAEVLGAGAKAAESAPALGGAAMSLWNYGLGAEKAAVSATEAASFARSLAGSAAKFGAEGAVLAAPQVVTEAALGDPKAAAEHLAWGLGGGVTLGALGTTAKAALKPLGKLAEGTARSLGFDLHSADPLGEIAAKHAFRSTIYSRDSKAIKSAMALEGGEEELGVYLAKNNLAKQPGEHFAEYAKRLGEFKEAFGREIGARYEQMDAMGTLGPTAEGLAERFKTEVIDPLRKLSTKSDEVRRLEGYLEDFKAAAALQNQARGRPGNYRVSLGDLWQTRRDLDSKIDYEAKAANFGVSQGIDKEWQKIRSIIDDSIKSAGGPTFKKEIEELGRNYRMISTANGIAKRSAVSELSNKHTSLSDMIFGHGLTGLVGHAMGGPVGAAAGIAGTVAHHYLRENGNAIVAKYANQLGTYFAHQAQLEAEKSISRLPSVLGALANRAPSKDIGALNGYRMLLGATASNDDQENLQLAQEHIGQLALNPELNAKHQDIVDRIAQGAPKIAEAYAQQEQARLQYLQQNLPPAPIPMPFGQPVTPSKKQARDFGDMLQIAIDPHEIYTHISNGTINKTHVKTCKDLYPATYQQIVDATKTWGITLQTDKKKGKKSKALPYQAIRTLSILTDEPLDLASQKVAAFQATFEAQQQPSAAPPTSPERMDIPDEQTQGQRLQSM